MPPLPCIDETGVAGASDLGDADLTFLPADVDNVTLDRSTDTIPDIVTLAPGGGIVGLSTVAVTISTALTETSMVTTTSRTITSARPTVSKHETMFFDVMEWGGLCVLCGCD